MKFFTLVKTTIIAAILILLAGCEMTTDVNQPTLVAILNPTDGAMLTEQTELNFSIVNDANLSYVQILIDGIETVRLNKGQKKCNFTPAFYKDGLKHTMLAITTDSDNQQSQSAVVTFSVGTLAELKPDFTTPSAGYIYPENSDINVVWNKIDDAVKYYVQLSEDKYFSSIVSEKTVTESQVSFGKLADKIYYMRMKAENKAGKTCDWSDYKKIYVGTYEFTWQNVFNYGGPEWANSVVALADSTYITGGPCYDQNSLDYAKMSIIKTDRTGSVIWNKKIGAENAISYANVIMQKSDYIYIVGGEGNSSGNNSKMLLTKMDKNGNVVWSRTYGSYDSWGLKAAIGNDGSIYISGDYNGSKSLVKINTNGDLVYSFSPQNSGDWLIFALDSADKVFAIYQDYNYDSHLIKLNSAGQIDSDIVLSNAYLSYPRSMIADNSGLYILASSSNVLKLGFDGTIINQHSFNSSSLYGITLANEALYTTGYNSSGMALMQQLNLNLDEVTEHTYCAGMLIDLAVQSDGSAILCGTDTPGIYEESNMLLIKTDKNGNCDNNIKTGNKAKHALKIKHDRIK